MQSANTLKFSRRTLLALAMIVTMAAYGQTTRYAVTVVGPANVSQLPTMGIDESGRAAGTCQYFEDGTYHNKAWTFDPGNGYLLSPVEESTINAVSPDGLPVGSAYGSPTVFDWLGNPLLHFPNGAGSFMAVNRWHDIAGYVFDPTNGWIQTAVIYDRNGNWTKLGSLDLVASAAYGINDHGDAVGSVNTATGECRAFFFRKSMTYLPGAEGYSDVAVAVNNNLNVVGYTVSPTDQVLPVAWNMGPLRVQQELMTLPVGFNNGYAAAINDNGQAVGTMWANDGSGLGRAFVTVGGTPVDLNELRAPTARVFQLVTANGINAKGQITGLAVVRIHVGGPTTTMAYVATPLTPRGGPGN